MPLSITVPATELFDSRTGDFIETKETVLHLEHSLISISKWESKWHKPYLSKDGKTREEALDYIRCMTLNSGVDPNVYLGLSESNIEEITKYMSDSMTATTIKQQNKRPSNETVTSELIYYWMTELNIPFDPCQKWHFSRLLTLIEVCSIKKTPSKKMSKSDILRQNHSLNAARRAKHHSRG
jgi:hypothetical protein